MIYKLSIPFITICLFLSACSSPQFIARETPGSQVIPDKSMIISSKEGLAISVRKTITPYAQGSKIIAFGIELINQTDHPIDFIPKDAFLFDQNNRQFPALPKEALLEASMTGRDRWANGGMSFGWSSGWRPGYYGSWWHSFGPYWDTPAPQRYEGMVGQALPTKPITIQPHARVSGNLYFGVPLKSISFAHLQISRFTKIPQKGYPEPRSIVYDFEFDVVD